MFGTLNREGRRFDSKGEIIDSDDADAERIANV